MTMFHINICGLARARCKIAEDQGRLGPKRGGKCYVTPAFSGIPKQRGTKLQVKTSAGVTMMPLGAPSISKYGSLARPHAQIVALRAQAPPMAPSTRPSKFKRKEKDTVLYWYI